MIVVPGQSTAVAVRHMLIPVESDVVKGAGQAVPAGRMRFFHAHHVGRGGHPHTALAQGPIHQGHLEFDGCTRFNTPGSQEKDARGADVLRQQGDRNGFRLPGDGNESEGQVKRGARW